MSTIRDRIKVSDDRRCEPYDWAGTEVKLVGLAHKDQEWIMEMLLDLNGKAVTMETLKHSPDIVIRGTMDPESGEPVFTEDDREWLRGKALIGDAALKIVTLTPLMSEEKDIEEAKNVSEPDQES